MRPYLILYRSKLHGQCCRFLITHLSQEVDPSGYDVGSFQNILESGTQQKSLTEMKRQEVSPDFYEGNKVLAA